MRLSRTALLIYQWQPRQVGSIGIRSTFQKPEAKANVAINLTALLTILRSGQFA